MNSTNKTNSTGFAALVLGAALVSFAAFGETWNHWEFGSEVGGVWTKGAVDSKGYGELRDGNWRIVAGIENDGTGRANLLAIKAPSSAWPASGSPHTVILDGTGEMDLSKPVYGANDVKMPIYRINAGALRYWNGIISGSDGRVLESFIAPPDVESIGNNALQGEDNALTLKRVDLYVPQCRSIGENVLGGVNASTYSRLYAPRCESIGVSAFRNSSHSTVKLDFSAQDFSLDRVETLSRDVFYGQYSGLTGTLRLPSIKTLCRSQFYVDSSVDGLVVGSDDPQIAQLELVGVADSETYSSPDKWNTYSVFCREGLINAKYLVIGSGTADTLIGRLAFDRTAGEFDATARKMIPRIYFTGTKPKMSFGAFYNHIDRNPKTSVFVIRRDAAGWDAIVAAARANSTSADEIDFGEKFGGNNLTYVGVVPTDPVYSQVGDVTTAVTSTWPTTPSTYFGNSAPQYLAYGSWRTEVNDVEVRNVMPDGTYLESRDLLGFWTEKDLKDGEERTVSVPAKILAADGCTYACDGYTLETATADGWSAPGAFTAGTNYVHKQSGKGSTRVMFKWRKVAEPFAGGASWRVDDDKWTALSGDAIEVSYSAQPDEFGNYPLGTEATLTPVQRAWTPADGLPKWGGAVQWDGNLEGCTLDETTGALRVPLSAGQRKLVARFGHEWLWEAETKTLWNRIFRLNAIVLDAGARTLKIGTGARDTWIKDATPRTDAPGLPSEIHEMQNRPLDLSQLIVDEKGMIWSIVEMGNYGLGAWTTYNTARNGSTNDVRLANYPSKVVFPRTLTALGHSVLYNRIGYDGLPLTSVVFDCPLLTGKLPDSSFYGFYRLEEVVLKIPNVTEIGNTIFAGCTSSGWLRETDLSTWDLSSVETITSRSFEMGGSVSGIKTGTLKLPKVTAVPERRSSSSPA